MVRAALVVASACMAILLPVTAAADDSPVDDVSLEVAETPRYEASFEPSLWPVVGALGPGLIVHGTGAFLLGDKKAAKRLLIAEGTGLSMFLGAGTLLALTGASRRLSGLLIPFVAVGGGAFMLSWLADVYAATTGGRDAGAVRWVTPLAVSAGYRYVYDPQFAYRNFSYARGDFRARNLRLSPSIWAALDDNNQRVRLDGAYRFIGRTLAMRAEDGSYVDASAAFTFHRYPNEFFSVWTLEGRVDARLDLARWGKSLSGAFVEGHVGSALELYAFDVPGASVRDDAAGMLLTRFGFGVYFGDGVRRTGELQVYYDHRHDDYAAGLGTAGIGSGFLGHFGIDGHYFFSERFGAAALFEVGAAYVAGLTALYRYRPEDLR